MTPDKIFLFHISFWINILISYFFPAVLLFPIKNLISNAATAALFLDYNAKNLTNVLFDTKQKTPRMSSYLTD